MAADTSQIGSWLRDRRLDNAAYGRKKPYSMEEAAHVVQSTAKTVWSWEKGNASPPADQFFALVRLYEAEGRLSDLYKSDASSARSRVRELPTEAFVPVRRSKDKKRGAG